MWPSSYPFAVEELRRLAAYKAAVEAGFYTDSCGGTAMREVGQPPSLERGDEACCTQPEPARLAAYRAAVRAGFYTDAL
jgi:hypothetical protein